MDEYKNIRATPPGVEESIPGMPPAHEAYAGFPHGISVKHTHDDNALVDVRLNNPLKRITQLLEDIKKQKAFSFTLKGSLGIMGVALAFSMLGILGGSKMLCDKGIQSQVGTVKALSIEAEEPSLWRNIKERIDYALFRKLPPEPQHRIILIQNDRDTIQLLGGVNTLAEQDGNDVVATGNYDSCSRALKLISPNAIEPTAY